MNQHRQNHVSACVASYIWKNYGIQFSDIDLHLVLISVRFKETGYDIKAYRNSLWQPDLIDLLPPASPYRDLMVDRTFDDNDNVFFLHLGRGVLKSDGSFHKGTTPKGWIDFAQEYILN